MKPPCSIPAARLLLAFLVVVLFVACQHATPYRPSEGDGEPGYISWQESGSVFHVRFVGALGAKLPEVRDLALLRAAELAHAAGSREFVILAEHNGKRTDWVRHNTAPPESPLVGANDAGGISKAHRDLAARSRSMITDSPAKRVEVLTVELKISTQPDGHNRAMDASASFVVETVLRDIRAKYGLTVAAQS